MNLQSVALVSQPVAVFEATVQRGTTAAGLARLAKESALQLRSCGKFPKGRIALRQSHAPGPGRRARLVWSFHGCELADVRNATARLTSAWPQWANDSRLLKFKLLEGPVAHPAPMAVVHTEEELCLQFDTPLRWRASEPTSQARLTADQFIELLVERMKSVSGQRLKLGEGEPKLGVLTHYGQLAWAGSGLADGSRMVTFQGALFLRNASPELVQVLALLQTWHLVQARDEQAVVWRGAYRLRVQRDGWLDKALLKRQGMAVTAHRLVTQHNTPMSYDVGGKLTAPLDVAQRLLPHLRERSYVAQPTEAFDLHRPGHAPRRVERLLLPDQLAQTHALKVMNPLLERVFEPSSFGYRPGRSRHDAIEQVRAALREGFTHVFESDIAQCFEIGRAHV